MKLISRIILVIIIIMSILIGIFPSIAKTSNYLILTISTIALLAVWILKNGMKGHFKVNVFLLLIIVLAVTRILIVENSKYIYLLNYLLILTSYYTISIVEFDEKFINFVAMTVAISVIPTIIFNGIANTKIEGGTSFSGRLNPCMYFPYVLIAIKLNNKNIFCKIILTGIVILTYIDILWSGSRIALVAMILMTIVFIKTKDKKTIEINKKTEKILTAVLIFLIILQIAIPNVYIMLYENYESELNSITFKWTGKNFFSGRQRVWTSVNKQLEGKEVWGTGDVNFNNLAQAPHNEFMNIYYCWGKVIAIVNYIYIYSIGKRCIKNVNTHVDLIILFGLFATLICTTFETYVYAMHFFVFNNCLTAYLLNKKENGVMKNEK